MFRNESIAPLVLRIGLSLVFLWFGWQQLGDPAAWVGVLPTWMGNLPINATTIIQFNAWFEIIFGLLLLFGFYLKIVALLLSLHLFSIVFTVGYSDIGVRDFGLAMATLSVFFSQFVGQKNTGGSSW